MAKIILIYTTNAWHEHSSMELIGIATSENQRDRLVRKYLREYLVEKPDRHKTDEAMEQIGSIGQTQCLAAVCDLEIHTETYQTNTLLL